MGGNARFHSGASPGALMFAPWGVWQKTHTSVVPVATISVLEARLCFVLKVSSVQVIPVQWVALPVAV